MSIDNAQAIDVPSKPKHSLLPLLIFLFLVSYGLLTLLVVEQDRTISSQRATIRQLLSDSSELAKRNATAGAQTQLRPEPNRQAPAGKERLKEPRKNHGAARPMPKFIPEKPPIPASDAADERRAPVSI